MNQIKHLWLDCDKFCAAPQFLPGRIERTIFELVDQIRRPPGARENSENSGNSKP
jgi:hypothetical protein